jgi:histidinol-phosphate aminotransferase
MTPPDGLAAQSSPLRLHANESPWGPSPKATLGPLTRYPQDGALEAWLAQRHGVEAGALVLGNGSTEPIGRLLQLVPEGEHALCAEQTFVAYGMLADALGVTLRRSPGRSSIVSLVEHLRQDTALVFLANPDNPTTTLFSADEVQAFAQALSERERPPIFVLDQAYIDFVPPAQRVKVQDLPGRVVVLHTLSKAHGLAGLRFGYALAPPPLAKSLRRRAGPFAVGACARSIAQIALEDEAHLQHVRSETARVRWGLAQGLSSMGLKVEAGPANFMLVHCGRSAKELAEDLKRLGVLVAPMDAYGWPRALRVGIPLPQDLPRLLQAFSTVLRTKATARAMLSR